MDPTYSSAPTGPIRKWLGGRPYIDLRRYAEGEPDPDRTWEIEGPVDDQIDRLQRWSEMNWVRSAQSAEHAGSSFRGVQQAARNDRLLGALRRLHLTEDRGQGLDRTEDDMALNLLHARVFATDGSVFSITLQLGGVVTSRERAWVHGLIDDDQLDPRSALVLVEIARHENTTNGQVRELLDADSVVARSIEKCG